MLDEQTIRSYEQILSIQPKDGVALPKRIDELIRALIERREQDSRDAELDAMYNDLLTTLANLKERDQAKRDNVGKR